jgi:hypothetical protein
MKKTCFFKILPLVQIVVVAACGTDSPQGVLAPSTTFDAKSPRVDKGSDDGNPRFSDWSSPSNVGPPVNSTLVEQGPAISKDGLSLYFQCMNCPGGVGGSDIWVSQRASVDEPWGAPRNLGPNINTTSNEAGPSVSTDGHTLYFISNRPGGFGANDLYMARRRDKRDDLGWHSAVNLGSAVNTSAGEGAPQPFNDDVTGTTYLYFNSDRPGGAGAVDIYVSARLSDGSFGQPVLVQELSSSFADQGVAIRKDGLELIFSSDRPGTMGFLDLWASTRATTRDSWSTPVNLGPTVNSEFPDAGADISFDGTSLYFHSALRPGGVGPSFDIWVTTREKVKGNGGN